MASAALLFLAALGHVSSASAMSAPNYFVNITLTDMSPLLHYEPPDAWMSWFSTSSLLGVYEPGMLGGGLSVHTSSVAGSSVFLEHPGSMSTIIAQVTNNPIDVVSITADGVGRPPVNPVTENATTGFFATSGPLEPGAHNLSVAYNPTGAQVNNARIVSVTSGIIEAALVAER